MPMPAILMSEKDFDRLNEFIEINEPSINALSLRAEINRATIIKDELIPQTVVKMGSTVTFRLGSYNKEFTYTLVYPDQKNCDDQLSVFSPVGSAIIGLSVGQSIEWDHPNGKPLPITVLSVSSS